MEKNKYIDLLEKYCFVDDDNWTESFYNEEINSNEEIKRIAVDALFNGKNNDYVWPYDDEEIIEGWALNGNEKVEWKGKDYKENRYEIALNEIFMEYHWDTIKERSYITVCVDFDIPDCPATVDLCGEAEEEILEILGKEEKKIKELIKTAKEEHEKETGRGM